MAQAQAALEPLVRLLTARLPQLASLELPLAALLELGTLSWAEAWAAGAHLPGPQGRGALRAATAGRYPGVYRSLLNGPHAVLLLPGWLLGPGAAGAGQGWRRGAVGWQRAGPCDARGRLLAPPPRSGRAAPPRRPQAASTHSAPRAAGVRRLSVTRAAGGTPVWPDDQPACVWMEPRELEQLEVGLLLPRTHARYNDRLVASGDETCTYCPSACAGHAARRVLYHCLRHC
jgi:hypothetical protein